LLRHSTGNTALDLAGLAINYQPKAPTKKLSRRLAPGRERNEVRAFWENIVDEIEIPIYDIPLRQRTRSH